LRTQRLGADQGRKYGRSVASVSSCVGTIEPIVDKREKISTYTVAYRSDYGFETRMVAARQRLILDLLSNWCPSVILEVGCGDELLVERASEVAFGTWVIVEPSSGFAARAHAVARDEPRLRVVDSFLEDATGEVEALCPDGCDLVVCASLLHEVEDPRRLLRALYGLLRPGGLLHANVPNKASLHRRLAKAMGLIADEGELSERDVAHGHHRVLDAGGLRELVESVGFLVVDEGGYMMKPFTHKQMESLPFVTEELIDGLYNLGRDLPDLASEIFVNCRRG